MVHTWAVGLGLSREAFGFSLSPLCSYKVRLPVQILHSLAWSAMSRSVSMLYVRKWLVHFYAMISINAPFPTGASLNTGSCDCDPKALATELSQHYLWLQFSPVWKAHVHTLYSMKFVYQFIILFGHLFLKRFFFMLVSRCFLLAS